MAEYDKLTVVKLREELVKRGLPKSGLKAALVQRLVEADAQSEQDVVPEASVPQESTQQILTDGVNDALRAPLQTRKAQPVEDTPAGNAVSSASDPQGTEHKSPAATVGTEATTGLGQDFDFKTSEATDGPEVVPLAPEVAHQASDHHERAHTPAPVLPDTIPATADTLLIATGVNAIQAAQAETPDIIEQSQAREQELQDVPSISAQASESGGPEVGTDSNKRKRRSQSPPPSSVETAQKRAKADNGRPHVLLPEDETASSIPEQEIGTGSMGDGPEGLPSEQPMETTQTDGPDQQDEGSGKDRMDTGLTRQVSMSIDTEAKVEAKSPPENKESTPPPPSTKIQSPLKTSSNDTRFKNLFNAPPKREGSPTRQLTQLDHEDRVVSPALHHATSALYIRDFMRPLNPGNLKDYLIALASPSDTEPDPDILTEFFLDTIRTHCLACFANTSAASRVRSGLHNRIWPDEKNRKPLWVDFVPEEKLQKWIEVESEAAADRRQGMKKWEVVYEEEKEGIMAYLQEAGPNSSAPRPAQAAVSQTESTAGVPGAPLGPRVKGTDRRTSFSGPAAKPDRGKAFGALDDLFSSTAAKPKLYFLPVARDIADKRLDRLAAGRGGGRGDEMRRYSFEEGTLVDKGPEFGMRGRGGFGSRGGGFRGYSGRGGSYRGDAWRSR